MSDVCVIEVVIHVNVLDYSILFNIYFLLFFYLKHYYSTLTEPCVDIFIIGYCVVNNKKNRYTDL